MITYCVEPIPKWYSYGPINIVNRIQRASIVIRTNCNRALFIMCHTNQHINVLFLCISIFMLFVAVVVVQRFSTISQHNNQRQMVRLNSLTEFMGWNLCCRSKNELHKYYQNLFLSFLVSELIVWLLKPVRFVSFVWNHVNLHFQHNNIMRKATQRNSLNGRVCGQLNDTLVFLWALRIVFSDNEHERPNTFMRWVVLLNVPA